MTIDQMQHVLDISFMVHGAVIGAYFYRKPLARPLHSIALGVGLLLVAFLALPYGYTYPYPDHSDILGRLIAATSPALIMVGVFALFSIRSRNSMGKKPATPTA